MDYGIHMTAPGAGLVTPEGVVVHVQNAGPGTRMVAKGLDVLIQAVAIAAFALADVAVSGGSLGTAGVVADLFAVPLILFGYPAVSEAVWRGRTLGKAALGLRVVTRDGAPCRFRHTLIRSVLFIVDGLLLGPAIGLLLLVLTRDTVRLGDLAAGTVVVRERTGAPMPAAATFDPIPGYEQLAAQLDVTRLSAADYEVVRSMLLRAPTLRPEVRWHVAADIAARIAGLVAFRPPPGLHPEAFLHTVASAYQRRHAVGAAGTGWYGAAGAGTGWYGAGPAGVAGVVEPPAAGVAGVAEPPAVGVAEPPGAPGSFAPPT